jgi:hypothetical protein
MAVTEAGAVVSSWQISFPKGDYGLILGAWQSGPSEATIVHCL